MLERSWINESWHPHSVILCPPPQCRGLQPLDASHHQRGIHHGGYTYRRVNQKWNKRAKQEARDKRGKIKIHNTLHTWISTFRNGKILLKYILNYLKQCWMLVCVVWLDAADCNEYLCTDTLNGSIDISIPRRHSVPVDSLGCMAGNEQSELELATKCSENFTIFRGGAKCYAKC